MNDLKSSDPNGLAQKFSGDASFVEELRRQMIHFATLQLSDRHLAEDAVQEALIGAMKNSQCFAGRSAFKTWVFAILKHKIADLLRQRRRQVEPNPLPQWDDDDEDWDQRFDRKGFWNPDDRPQEWGQPESSLHNTQFWRVFETCLEHLSGQQARVFMMREFVGLETQEICAELHLTVSHLNVLLYRARLRLRKCLESRWFLEEERC